MSENNTFYSMFNNAEKVKFHTEWNNGTGYYDGACDGPCAPKLEFGHVVASVSPMPNNRKIIIFGGEGGENLVFNERYTDGAHGVIVSCGEKHLYPEEIRKLMHSQVSDDGFAIIVAWFIDRALTKN